MGENLNTVLQLKLTFAKSMREYPRTALSSDRAVPSIGIPAFVNNISVGKEEINTTLYAESSIKQLLAAKAPSVQSETVRTPGKMKIPSPSELKEAVRQFQLTDGSNTSINIHKEVGSDVVTPQSPLVVFTNKLSLEETVKSLQSDNKEDLSPSTPQTVAPSVPSFPPPSNAPTSELVTATHGSHADSMVTRDTNSKAPSLILTSSMKLAVTPPPSGDSEGIIILEKETASTSRDWNQPESPY